MDDVRLELDAEHLDGVFEQARVVEADECPPTEVRKCCLPICVGEQACLGLALLGHVAQGHHEARDGGIVEQVVAYRFEVPDPSACAMR